MSRQQSPRTALSPTWSGGYCEILTGLEILQRASVRRGVTRAATDLEGQYGLPYLITAVGVLVHLHECALVRVTERGEEISVGEPRNFFIELQVCATAIEDCERLARQHADEAVRKIRAHHPELGPDDPQVAKKAQLLERVLLGGDSSMGTTAMPAMVALRRIYSMMSRLDGEMGRRS